MLVKWGEGEKGVFFFEETNDGEKRVGGRFRR